MQMLKDKMLMQLRKHHTTFYLSLILTIAVESFLRMLESLLFYPWSNVVTYNYKRLKDEQTLQIFAYIFMYIRELYLKQPHLSIQIEMKQDL